MRGARRRDQPALRRRVTTRHLARRDRRRGRLVARLRAVPGRAAEGAFARRHVDGDAPTASRRPAAHDARSSPTRSSTATTARPRCCATCAASQAKDLALDRVDDPARLLHDEAERHGRDDPDHLAGVRQHASVRPGGPGRGLPAAVPRPRARGSREITGFDAVSLQPNAGSQGEYAGLLAIRAWHEQPRRGRTATSASSRPRAHGTNPASAVMAGHAGRRGRLRRATATSTSPTSRPRRTQHATELAALMVTYPRTHGVFEDGDQGHLRDRPRARRPGLHGRRQHERAGRPGPARRVRRRRLPPQPAQDLLHPARRRRPRHGPDRRRARTSPLPAGPPVVRRRAARGAPVGPVAAAPWGSASILPISWVYIRDDGRRRA